MRLRLSTEGGAEDRVIPRSRGPLPALVHLARARGRVSSTLPPFSLMARARGRARASPPPTPNPNHRVGEHIADREEVGEVHELDGHERPERLAALVRVACARAERTRGPGKWAGRVGRASLSTALLDPKRRRRERTERMVGPSGAVGVRGAVGLGDAHPGIAAASPGRCRPRPRRCRAPPARRPRRRRQSEGRCQRRTCTGGAA